MWFCTGCAEGVRKKGLRALLWGGLDWLLNGSIVIVFLSPPLQPRLNLANITPLFMFNSRLFTTG